MGSLSQEKLETQHCYRELLPKTESIRDRMPRTLQTIEIMS